MDEASRLCDSLFWLSQAAHSALGQHDTDAVLSALEQRDAVLQRLDPALQSLTDVRTGLADRAHSEQHDRELNEALAALEQAVSRIQASDARLTERLRAGRASIARDLDRMEYDAPHAERDELPQQPGMTGHDLPTREAAPQYRRSPGTQPHLLDRLG